MLALQTTKEVLLFTIFFLSVYCSSVYLPLSLSLDISLMWNKNWNVADTMQIIEQELKNQKKHVKRLRKKSLWFKMLEEVDNPFSLAYDSLL